MGLLAPCFPAGVPLAAPQVSYQAAFPLCEQSRSSCSSSSSRAPTLLSSQGGGYPKFPHWQGHWVIGTGRWWSHCPWRCSRTVEMWH